MRVCVVGDCRLDSGLRQVGEMEVVVRQFSDKLDKVANMDSRLGAYTHACVRACMHAWVQTWTLGWGGVLTLRTLNTAFLFFFLLR